MPGTPATSATAPDAVTRRINALPVSATYTVPFPREQWVDSSANNDGNALGDGNVTG